MYIARESEHNRFSLIKKAPNVLNDISYNNVGF